VAVCAQPLAPDIDQDRYRQRFTLMLAVLFSLSALDPHGRTSMHSSCQPRNPFDRRRGDIEVGTVIHAWWRKGHIGCGVHVMCDSVGPAVVGFKMSRNVRCDRRT